MKKVVFLAVLMLVLSIVTAMAQDASGSYFKSDFEVVTDPTYGYFFDTDGLGTESIKCFGGWLQVPSFKPSHGNALYSPGVATAGYVEPWSEAAGDVITGLTVELNVCPQLKPSNGLFQRFHMATFGPCSMSIVYDEPTDVGPYNIPTFNVNNDINHIWSSHVVEWDKWIKMVVTMEYIPVGRDFNDFVTLYIDGVQVVQKTNVGKSSYTFSSGAYIGLMTANYAGKIDDLAVYNYAKTPEQILADYNAEFGVGGFLTGTVTLGDYIPSPAGLPISVVVNGTETLNTTLDAAGAYSVTTAERGECSVEAKVSHWLSQATTATVDATGAGTANFTLTNGDCSLDNAVDESDFGMISLAWYTSNGDAGYDGAADLNGDEVIDESDFGIISLSWYLSGPV